MPVRASALLRSPVRQTSSPALSPPATMWRDIFSLPGTIEVTSQVDLDSSSETKIAPRSTRTAACSSD